MAWSEAFGDPVLQGLITEGLRANYDLLIAAERVMQARALVTITGADQRPEVAAGASFESSKLTENGALAFPAGVDGKSEQWLVSGNLSWELDFWGRFARASEAARAELLSTEHARRAVMQSLVAQIAQGYFDLLLFDAQLEITRRNLESRSKSFDLVSLRLEQGVSNKAEYYQAQGLMLDTAGRIPDLKQSITQQENLLRFLTGAGPGPILRGEALMDQDFEISIPIGLPSDLLERRPDVGQAEQALVAANARIGEARALLYPSIRLTAFGGLASEDLSDLTSGGSDIWDITPSISLPIFNAGRLRANVDVSESQQREAALRYSKTLQNAFREVADALIGRQSRGEVRDWSEQFEASQRGLVELSRDRYHGGVTSYLEVLDSERGHFESEINLALSVRDELLAYILLYSALGGGWQAAEEQVISAEASDADSGS
ncbi:MAG: multidrug efflux system outer membrane protein [Chlamydiales bacterium]